MNQPLGLRMVNEGRLKRREYADELLDRHIILRRGRVFCAEGLLDHLQGEIGEGESLRPWRVDKELPFVQVLAALPIIVSGIYINAMHEVISF